MTHQDIVDRTEALGNEHSAAYRIELARIDKERASLRELCGGLGHVFRKPAMLLGPGRACVFCGHPEGSASA